MQSSEMIQRLPTFSELITYYGPYLGLIVALIISILIMQFYWFNRIVKAKNKEIDRLIHREEIMAARCFKLIDDKIAANKPQSL